MDIPVITIMISDMTAMNLIREFVFMEIHGRGILTWEICLERIESDDIKARNIPGA